MRIGLRQVRTAPVLDCCQQPARLGSLPLLTSWHSDGGAFVTLPLVYTEHPDGSGHNLGMYRVQRFDDTTTGIHWQIHKGGGYHYWAAEQTNQDLPLTLYIGGPPALMLAAIAPLPENIPELLLASLLMGSKLAMADDPKGGHRLVAEAEFAVKGVVPPHLRRPEGPFGDHYGYNSLQHEYPVFQTTHLYHRRDAIYPATVVGRPRQEDYFIGDFLQDLLSPLFPLVMKGVLQLKTFGETGFHCLAAARVTDRYPREAFAAGLRILGEGQLSLTKFLLITDGSIDVGHFPRLWQHILERIQWDRDLFVFANVSQDTLDYTGPSVNKGSKAMMLGLGQAKRRDLPETLPVHCRRNVRGRWPTCRAPWWSRDRPTNRRRTCRAASPTIRAWLSGRWYCSSIPLPKPPPPCRSSSGPSSPASNRPRTSMVADKRCTVSMSAWNRPLSSTAG
jgi:UbiD family decarboxylase